MQYRQTPITFCDLPDRVSCPRSFQHTYSSVTTGFPHCILSLDSLGRFTRSILLPDSLTTFARWTRPLNPLTDSLTDSLADSPPRSTCCILLLTLLMILFLILLLDSLTVFSCRIHTLDRLADTLADSLTDSLADSLHQEKNSASGCRGCVRTLYTRLKCLDARDAPWQGSLRPDDTCHGICLPDKEWQGICLLDAACQGKFLPDAACQGKGRTVDACHGICLLDEARVFRTQGVKAKVVWTTRAMASAFRTRSVRAFPF